MRLAQGSLGVFVANRSVDSPRPNERPPIRGQGHGSVDADDQIGHRRVTTCRLKSLIPSSPLVAKQASMKIQEPCEEHLWLHRLVGDWRFEIDCSMDTDQPPTKSIGSEIVHSMGGLWMIGEGISEAPDGTTHTSIMTLGFDPAKNCFIGTFVSSTMTHLWPYTGSLNSEGNILTLDSEGPNLNNDGAMAKYQDKIELVDDHHRILSSQVQGADGLWTKFMTAHYFRKTN